MADKIYDVGRFRHSIDNWQLSMLLGIIFFIVGIVVFFEPGGTYLALSVLFGIVVILSGAFELYLGTKAPTGSGKGWYIAGGVVEILLGYPAAVHPVDALHDPAVRARLLAPLPGIHGGRRRQRDDGCGYQGRRLDDDAGYSRDYFRVSRSVQSDYRCRCSRVLGGIVPAAGRCRFDCTRCHSAAVAQGAVTVDNVPIRLRPGNILPGRSVFYTDSR